MMNSLSIPLQRATKIRRLRCHRHLFTSSSSTSSPSDSEEPPANSATILQGPSLLSSTGVQRPSPSLFHLPGLRSLPFWTSPVNASSDEQQHQRRHRIAFNDPLITHAVEHIETNFNDIKAEYFDAVLGQSNVIDPSTGVAKPLEPDYDTATKGGEHADDALHTGSWDWHSYIQNGVKNEEFKARCPKTAQVVDVLEREGMLFGSPFSFCFFSTLHGKSSIKAHSGPMNLRLRMHLPLVVPKKKPSTDNKRPQVGIRVADQQREWHEGSAIILDDSFVHEVWNDTDEPRVLFLLDLWHPDIRSEEKEKISNMFDFARGKGWIGKKSS